jgi:discoidin domain receptor family protein 2
MLRPHTPAEVVLLYLLWAAASDSTSAACNDSLPIREMSASSAYQEAVGPHQGRLDNEAGGGAWCPKGLVASNSGGQELEFLQLDLGDSDSDGDVEFVLRAVVVQGRWANGLGQEYAEQIMVHYWRPGLAAFLPYVNAKGGAVLQANRDTNSKVMVELAEASGRLLTASKVRIIPVSPHPRTVCLRVGLLGCPARGQRLYLTLNCSWFVIF